jgi:hypothetical protein
MNKILIIEIFLNKYSKNLNVKIIYNNNIIIES